MSARDEILERIRAALGPQAAVEAVSPPTPAVDDRDGASRSPASGADRPRGGEPERVARFVERVEDYRATVTRCAHDEIAATVATICARHGVGSLAVPAGLEPAWVPAAVAVLGVGAVDPAAVRALDAVDGVLTSCALGVAETGTIVLDGGPGQGPRAATLLPDLHVCVVAAGAIVAGVPELTAWMGEAVRRHGRPLTMISGPSATSDIELDRVEGVHGPRRLEVIVAQSPPESTANV